MMHSSGVDTRTSRRAILAATIGNTLEFYDFITFAFFAIQIGQTFFPSHDHFLSLMGSLATFGAGFITRPIGAWVIGGYADRKGRKPALFFSMTLMGIGIVVLALTPGYATLGYAAPLIAVGARLLQGFALGGEVGAATSYMLEAVPAHKRGFAASWQNTSQMIAFSIGALVGFALTLGLTETALASYGWRIALLLGASIVPFALAIRQSLPDTAPPTEPETDDPISWQPVRVGFARVVVLGMTMIGMATTTTYCFIYMTTYAQNTLHLSTRIGMAGELTNDVAGAIAALWGGLLCDRHGRRPAMIWPQISYLVVLLPCFFWLIRFPGVVSFLTANAVLSFFSSMPYSAAFVWVAENLPRGMRARGFALIYTIPVTFLGGGTQLLITWLLKITGDPMTLAWYLVATATLSLAAMLLASESAPHRLRAALA